MFQLIRNDPNLTSFVSPNQASTTGQPWKDRDGRICAYTYQDGQYYWMLWPGIATFRFELAGDDVLFTPEGSQPEKIIQDLFWRSVAPLIMQVRGKEALHASAIKTKNGIAAFCAVSGTGKSTLAYGFVRRGYPLWTDDALIFENHPDGILAIPLPSYLRLLPETLSFFEQTAGSQVQNWTLDHQRKERLSIIFILEKLEDQSCCVEIEAGKLTGSEAFQKLLSHAYCFSLNEKDNKKRLAQDYLDLTAQIPVVQVQFPADLNKFSDLVNLIETFL